MSIKRNLESIIESAFVSVIGQSSDIGTVPVRHWQSPDNGKIYPIILVYCQPVENDTVNARGTADLYECEISIACMTYSANDRNKSALYNLVGLVRDKITDSSTLASLKTASSNKLNFYCTISNGSNSQYDQNGVNLIMLTYKTKIQYINS